MISERNPGTVLQQGEVEKKTDGLFFKWHSRYMVLTVDKVHFFASKDKEKLIGCINLKLLPAKLNEQEGCLVMDFCG